MKKTNKIILGIIIAAGTVFSSTLYSEVSFSLEPGLDVFEDTIGYNARAGIKLGFNDSGYSGFFTGISLGVAGASVDTLNLFRVGGGLELGYNVVLPMVSKGKKSRSSSLTKTSQTTNRFWITPSVTLGLAYHNLSDSTLTVPSHTINFAGICKLGIQYEFARNVGFGINTGVQYDYYKTKMLDVFAGVSLSYYIPTQKSSRTLSANKTAKLGGTSSMVWKAK